MATNSSIPIRNPENVLSLFYWLAIEFRETFVLGFGIKKLLTGSLDLAT